tara:strand:+ start:824 stop:1063 length:240 start_codon:yes stop_codon:yes gene_type:complete
MPHYSYDPSLNEPVYNKAMDDSPVRSYQVHLSDRQVESLKGLKRRNFAGFSSGTTTEVAAIIRMINEVGADDESLDNYD